MTCRAIVDPAARVECYDQIVDAASSIAAPSAPESSTADPEEHQQLAPQDRFGLSEAEARRQAGLELKKDDLDLIEAKITHIARTGYDKFVVTLDNGQTWRQTDTKKLRLRHGDAVRISSAAFGSFLLEKSTGSRMIRVQRIE